MPDPMKDLQEHPSTYTVQDRSNLEEMTRLNIQDKMLTAGMGGVLPELADPTMLQSVLDVGCGTGGWLTDLARAYPNIERLVGADVSAKMLVYARTQAESQGLAGRVEFHVMDALRILEFPKASFDLVNQRAAFTWLRTWEWKKILMEHQRVSRPGGIIRIVEVDVWSGGNSPALTKLCDIGLEAFYNSGRLFNARRDGVTSELAHLMTLHGIENVQTHLYSMVYRTGMAEHESFYKDMYHSFRVALPFLQKWTRVPDNFQEIYQQALKEIQQPDFEVTWKAIAAWGTSPSDGRPMRMRGLQ